MLVKVVWLTTGTVFGAIAVASANEYFALASGRMVIDFIPWETNGESQRQYIRTIRTVALVSTLGCITSFVLAFRLRATQLLPGRFRGQGDCGGCNTPRQAAGALDAW